MTPSPDLETPTTQHPSTPKLSSSLDEGRGYNNARPIFAANLQPLLLNTPSSMESNTASPPSTLTLGLSSDAGSRTSPVANAYNLNRFLGQNQYDDSTLHDRVSHHTSHPLPDAYVLAYKARATAIVAACDALLNRDLSQPHPK